jgi:CRP/FNR family transcriptional regulator, nitrogen fixation regulation protein
MVEEVTVLSHERSLDRCAGTTVAFNRGDIIFRQGDFARHWFEVVSGVVRSCRFHVDGHRHLTGFFYPGDVIGAESGLYQATAEAITRAELLRNDQCSSHTEHLNRALRSAQQCIYLFGHRSAMERLSAFLLSIAQRSGRQSTEVALPMSRADIADHLGLTIHTVSRTITELARRSIIATEGPRLLRIIDMSALAHCAGETEPHPNS